MKTHDKIQQLADRFAVPNDTMRDFIMWHEGEMHEYGKTLQGTILDLEWDFKHHKEKAAREIELLESKVDELTESYQLEQEENIRIKCRQSMKKKPHGGARKGAGAPKKEPTVVMRIPVSKVAAVLKLISPKEKRQQPRQQKPPSKSG